MRRVGEENGVAVGWPMAVQTYPGAPAIRPVGLVAAAWSRNGDLIELLVDADDIVVNPDWVKSTARLTPWTEKGLQNLFRGIEDQVFQGKNFLQGSGKRLHV